MPHNQLKKYQRIVQVVVPVLTCHVLIDRNWTHIVGQPDLNSPETELVEYEKGYDREVKVDWSLSNTTRKKHNGLVTHLLDNHKL